MNANADVETRLYAALRESGDELIGNLIQAGQFRGGQLEIIRRVVLRHLDDEVGQRYLWTALMPESLSLVSAKGRCNLSCRMCTGGPEGTLEYLTEANMRTILHHVPTCGNVTLVAADAEPLLNPEFDAILDVLALHKQKFMLVTNGHLLKPTTIDRLVAYPEPRHVNVSIDAATQETYAKIRGAKVDRVFRNVKRLMDTARAAGARGLHTSLLMVGMSDNIHELPEFVARAAEVGAARVKLDHMMGGYDPGDFTVREGWRDFVAEATEVAKRSGVILQLPMDVNGGTPRTATVCDWFRRASIEFDGTINPCCMTRNVRLGNVYETPMHRNRDFLEAALHLAQRNLLDECWETQNCDFVNTVRREGGKPPRTKLPVVA